MDAMKAMQCIESCSELNSIMTINGKYEVHLEKNSHFSEPEKCEFFDGEVQFLHVKIFSDSIDTTGSIRMIDSKDIGLKDISLYFDNPRMIIPIKTLEIV